MLCSKDTELRCVEMASMVWDVAALLLEIRGPVLKSS